MIALEQVKELWQKRGAQIVTSETIGGWFVNSYAAAAGRIEHRDELADNIHWYSEANESCAMLDARDAPVVQEFDGSESTPEAIRARAFELLVLADIAESMAP